MLYLLVAALAFVIGFRGHAFFPSVILLLDTAAGWRFSRWYQRRYPA